MVTEPVPEMLVLVAVVAEAAGVAATEVTERVSVMVGTMAREPAEVAPAWVARKS